MIPIMYVISGTLREIPQRTHRWNNTKLKPSEIRHFEDRWKVFCQGVETSGTRSWFWIPLFHIPILGGWKDYVVLQPSDSNQEWHVGWIASDTAGVSRIKLHGPVRMLLGPGDASFFGVDVRGTQLPISEIARGHIGDNGPHKQVPLL